MSSRSQMDSREQPFQVVTQKRPSGQARKVSNKPPTSRTQSQQYSDDPNSTGTNLTNGNNRKRLTGGQHSHSQHPPRDSGKQSNTRSGNSVQIRARDPEEREGGTTIRHSNRHSWDSDTASQLQNRSTADKIERSQSARFDRINSADTSNRFERLNPDAEAPGEAKPGSTRNRKRNSRSVSGSSSYRSRSPKRKSGKDQKGSQATERGREKDNSSGTTATASCELEWDSGTNSLKQQEGELVGTAENLVEPTSTAGAVSGSSPVQLLDQTSIDKTSGASAQGGDGSSATASDPGEEGGKDLTGSDMEKTKQIRLSYTRDELLGMRHLPLSQKKPDSLKGKFFRGGKWCADAWLAQNTLTSDEKEELEEIESVERHPGKTLPKLKNPTTLSIIREHDPKGYGKVSLSPQRRSFGSGCSWKDASSSTSGSAAVGAKDGQTIATPNSSRSGFQPHNNLPSHSHTNHTSRVINHTPLQNQKGWKVNGGKRGGDKDRDKSYGGYKGHEIEDEPEWMAFGPSDRSEVIELVGFDEHEKGRDNDDDGEDATIVANEGEGGREGGREAASEEEGSPKTSEGSVGVEEGVVGIVTAVMGEEEKREEGKVTKEPENEFMLDGFDFSTSVSICQALASDEEDEEDYGSSGHRVGGAPLPPVVSDPNELSSVLMKALRVGKEEEACQSGGHPANALTLEEVHERENIHTQPPSQSDADQSAFNRLVAVLQSSGAIQDEPNTSQPPLPQKLPRPPVPLAMPHKLRDHNIMAGRVPPGGRGLEQGTGGGSLGYLLEKELRLSEDYTSSPHLSRMPAYHNSPAATKMDASPLLRENYGGGHAKSLFPYPHSHQPPSLTNRPSTLHDKWTERSWIYPENQSMEYGGLQRPVDSLGHPVMHHHHHHQSTGRSGSLASRPPSNKWAIEMEQRRLMELQEMRERERGIRERMMARVPAGDPVPHLHTSSKPNISLLPTAVMKQLHISNPNHLLSDMTARTSQSSTSDRLEQDLTSRPVYSHSSAFNYSDMVGGVNHSRDYPYPTSHMRVPPRPQPRGGMGLYTPPPQYIPIPHGIPNQQNPYLH